jgi:hypothetical protein
LAKFDSRARFLWVDPEDDPEGAKKLGADNRVNTEAECLCVSEVDFWYDAYQKDKDGRFFSDHIPLSALTDILDVTPQKSQEAAVTNERLASIVGHLLTNPFSGEVDEQETFQKFLTAITQVVCDFCGGEITSPVAYVPEPGDMDWGRHYRLGVKPNDSSPADGGIWHKTVPPFAPVAETSQKVKHWDCYGSPERTAVTHQFDVDDQRRRHGQVFLTLGATEGLIDDAMYVTMEVNTNPLNGVDHVPCAHVAFDSETLAASLFKVGDDILLRCEAGVKIEPVPGTPETYWLK